MQPSVLKSVVYRTKRDGVPLSYLIQLLDILFSTSVGADHGEFINLLA